MTPNDPFLGDACFCVILSLECGLKLITSSEKQYMAEVMGYYFYVKRLWLPWNLFVSTWALFLFSQLLSSRG
jgi:hypothetical protein